MAGLVSRLPLRFGILLVIAWATCLVSADRVFAQQDDAVPVAGTHAERPSPALWVADGTFAEFAHKSLKKTGTPEPEARLTGDGVSQGIQFDHHGDLWGLFTNFGPDQNNLIFEMTPEDIERYESTHVLSPTVSISNSCSPLYFGQGFKLDPSGNVWLVCSNLIPGSPQQIFEYTKSQFGPSVSSEPAVSIEPSGVVDIGAIQFDRSGNLWMTGATADQPGSVIMKVTRHQLMSSGNPAPALIITVSDGSPIAMAFDHHGNLWALMDSHPVPTVVLTDTVESFSAKSLSGTGTITLDPAITLDLSAEGILLMFDLTFDKAGNLWLGGGLDLYQFPRLLKLTANQLRKNGKPKSRVVLTSDDKGDNLGVVRSLTIGPSY